MKANKLTSLSDEELIRFFAAASLRVYKAKADAEHESEEDNERISREIKAGWAIGDELKRRGDTARLKLMSLYDDPNVQVRLDAATATLALVPTKAREIIEAVASWQEFPQSGEAGMRLWALDRGIFKPT